MDVASVVNQLRPQRIGEALHGMLGSAVGGLQRDGSIGKRGSDLDDHAPVARQHPTQGGQRTVHVSEIGHIGDATELFRRHVLSRRQNGHHGVIDPDVDGTEMSLDRFGCFLDLVIVGHIGRQGEGTTSGRFDFPPGRLQPVAAAREKRHPGAASGKFAHSRAPDSGGCPGDDDDLPDDLVHFAST